MGYPRAVDPPEPDDVVAVLMSEKMARRFEQRCLGRGNTAGGTRLSPPVKFREDDVPTYVVEVDECEVIE